jgi:ribonuclease HI
LNIQEIVQKFPSFDQDKIANLLDEAIQGLEKEKVYYLASPSFTVYIDGACRGNPGPGSFGVVMCNEKGEVVEQLKDTIGLCTNNVAEYTALLKALEKARKLKVDTLLVKSDSQLLVKQLEGAYKVKDEKIKILYDQVQDLLKEFKSVEFMHIPRVENKLADELANKALDEAEKQNNGSLTG